ncbi:MAG: O-antigen ligase family protein [Patescibacteria group bacterium]
MLKNNNLILTTILVIFLTEILSYLGWRSPLLGSIAAILLTIVWLIIAARNLSMAMVWLTLELILGGFGYWLSFEVGNLVLSMRMLLFGAGVSLLIYKLVVNKQLEFFKYKIKWWYGACGLVFILSVVVGSFNGNESANIILDGQRYLYWLLLPLWFEINLSDFKKYATVIFPVGLIWLFLKTSAGLYIFGHFNFEQVKWFYTFWRDIRFAEITHISDGMFRIFSQSHIYAGIFGLGLWVYNLFSASALNWRAQFSWYLISALGIFTAVMSFSRSFWLAIAVSLLLINIVLLFKKYLSFNIVIKQCGIMLLIVLAGFGYMLTTTRLNWPIESLSSTETSSLSSRLTSGDAATNSRMQLWGPLTKAISGNILIGQGFGATVTYFTSDPRRVAQTAGGSGEYTTYAFEWGYLELWLKFGLVGLVVYLGFIIRSLLPIWHEAKKGRAVLIGLSAGILVLLITNITTPYLNHALGIGALMLVITLVNKENYATN